jgi:uncharacterized membrane protein YccC
VLVAGIVVAVVVLLLVLLRWADRRDRGKGHVNRSARDVHSAIRGRKMQKLSRQVDRRRRG